MNANGLFASLAMLTIAPGLGLRAQVDVPRQQEPGYARQVSTGSVTLELAPEWQDSVLVVLVRAEAESGELGVINLKEQVRLMVNRQVYAPETASALRGRRAVAWVIFRLPRKPQKFAISIWKVPDTDLRILRWSAVPLTP